MANATTTGKDVESTVEDSSASIFDRLDSLLTSEDTGKIRQTLQKLNGSFELPTNKVRDNFNESSFANFRKNLEKLTLKDIYEGEEKLGIFLFSEEITLPSGRVDHKIYVDVPDKNFDAPAHPDNSFRAITVDPRLEQQRVFYPADQFLMLTQRPAPGDIVRVRISKNYGNTEDVNPRDNKYLGIYMTKTVLPSTDPTIVSTNERVIAVQAPINRKKLVSFPPREGAGREWTLAPWRGAFSDFPIFSLVGLRDNPRTPEYDPRPHQGLDIRIDSTVDLTAFTTMRIDKKPTRVWDPADKKNTCGVHFSAVEIKDDGTEGDYRFIFCHLSASSIPKDFREGSTIKAGEKIGNPGDTGYYGDNPNKKMAVHLHLEIRDRKTGREVNPLYLFKGVAKLEENIRKVTGYPEYIDMPVQGSEDKTYKLPFEGKYVLPAPADNSLPATKAGSASKPASRPKLLLKPFITDELVGVIPQNKKGSTEIKVREDLLTDLEKIKKILNNYKIPFSCIGYDINLNNKNLSLLAKVGLEIKLNPFAGFSKKTNFLTDDYYIGPDFSKPLGNGYKNIIYGVTRISLNYFDIPYKPEKKVIEVYDSRAANRLETVKLFKTVVNISKIFEDFGFININPLQTFFTTGDPEQSNWNIYQKPLKINKGYSYKQLLETVYFNNNEPIWNFADLKWDGEKFI